MDTDPLIGRDRELAELEAALDRSGESLGGIVMLAGEPGIGKTRLTEELESIAISRGFKVGRGTSFDGGSTPPYWPWIQILRSLSSDSSPVIQAAYKARADVFAEIVPEIDELLAGNGLAPVMDSAQAKFRLLDSIATFLKEISSEHPVVLVFDDLHWADSATLELLRFVVQQSATQPILFLGTYRDAQLSRKHPLSETLAALARVRNFRRIPVRGLNRADVALIINSVGDLSVAPAVVQEIHLRTEGNPFFVFEVVRDMERETNEHRSTFDAVGFRIPEGVSEAIGIRLNTLSEECNEILRTAAIIGKLFDFKLLAALHLEFNEDSLFSLIEEATASGIIREVGGQIERYDFSHALIQETLEAEITAGRRTRIHAYIIDAIEELYSDDLSEHATELAHHCAHAETIVDKDRSIRYTTLAGEKASAGYSWIEARTHFERALETLGDAKNDEERAAILFGLGKAELFSLTYPEIQRGWENVSQAFDLYVKLGDTQAAVAVTTRSGGFFRHWVDGTSGVYGRALELVAPGSADEADLLEKYAVGVFFDEEDLEGTKRTLQQALEIAKKMGDERIECRVLNSLAGTRISEGDFSGAVDIGLQALELARKSDQPIEEFGCRDKIASALISLGEPTAAIVHLDTAKRMQDRFGVFAAIELLQYLTALLQGQLAKADVLREELERQHADDSVIRLLGAAGAWHTQSLPDVDERMNAAKEQARSASTQRQQISNIGLLAVAAHVMDRSRDAIDAGELARSVLSTPGLMRQSEKYLRAAAGLTAVVIGDAGEAAEHYRHLESWRGIMSWAGAFPLISGDRLLGLLAHTAAMPVKANAHFEAALEFSGTAGYRLESIWIGHDYAETLISRAASGGSQAKSGGDVEQAISLIDESLAIAREIGSAPLEKRLLALQKKVASISAPASGFPDGLTPREIDVLRLLAAGSTNQQIADQLVVALNTVRTHVANILGKTGAANRTEAAIYAAQKGYRGPDH